MRILSWNVNGLRSCIKKGFWDFFEKSTADIFCIQEIKMTEEQFEWSLPGYTLYWHPAEKKGYAGTVIIARNKALNATYGLNDHFTQEGRVITLEYDDFYIINCYAPHSQRDLNHLVYKGEFNASLIKHIKELQQTKPVIVCGDLNVAHQDLDLANPKANIGNAGFTELERNDFGRLLALNLIDSYRYKHPEQTGAYTWWSNRKGVRERNIGWRIDYILLSHTLSHNLLCAFTFPDVFGSDHCPIGIDIDL